jgi:response regulator RpfG family c-di-GMP phosphodiesterase
MKIFICEQDPYRAKLIQDILGVYNYKIVTVQKQAEFFREAHNQKPAVIVMNQMFAENCETDILSKMRKDPVTSSIPVIYISDKKPAEDSFDKQMLDTLTEFVQEPIKIKNLRHYIDRWTTFRSLYIKH